jgi:hypothetical protein
MLEDYLSLPYTIEIIPDDGAWFAQIKELPGCMTEVDAWNDILPAIEDVSDCGWNWRSKKDALFLNPLE